MKDSSMVNFFIGLLVVLIICAIVFTCIKTGKIDNPFENLHPNDKPINPETPINPDSPTDPESPVDPNVGGLTLDYVEIIF